MNELKKTIDCRENSLKEEQKKNEQLIQNKELQMQEKFNQKEKQLKEEMIQMNEEFDSMKAQLEAQTTLKMRVVQLESELQLHKKDAMRVHSQKNKRSRIAFCSRA